MANETIITVVGNTTAEPDLRYSQAGKPVANFTIASTPRTFDKQSNEWKDGEALFLRCSVWGDYAEHVAGSITKGTRIVVTGRLKQRSYETREGEKRTVVELEADEVAVSLRYATAQVTRAVGGNSTRQQPSASQQEIDDAWAAPQGTPAVLDEPWAAPYADTNLPF